MLGRSDRCRGQLRLFNIRCVVVRVPRRFRVLAPKSLGESLDRCVRSRLAGHFDGAAAAIVNKQRRAYYHYVLSGSCDRDLFRCPLVVFRKRSRTADNPAKGRRCVL